jgi:Bifunctional DNA primase/polymerase, N-terminal
MTRSYMSTSVQADPDTGQAPPTSPLGLPRSTDDLPASALDYAQHGWWVFPLRPRGKVPMGGRGFKDATRDPAEVEDIWKRHPKANIGVRTGQLSGISVLDIDPESGGGESLEKIETEHGPLPGTITQVTGGGGVHLMYRYKPGLGIGAAVWGPGLDLRSEGGYIVAAPSIHPNGCRYRWLGDLWRDDLAEWPGSLRLPERIVPPAPTAREYQPVGDGGPLVGLIQTVLDGVPGDRNARLNWAAWKAREHIMAGRFDSATAVAALQMAAEQVGLPTAEALRTIASGLGVGHR